MTSNLEKSTVSILDLVGSAVRVHLHTVSSSQAIPCYAQDFVSIADSSSSRTEDNESSGYLRGNRKCEENFEDASSNFVQAVRIFLLNYGTSQTKKSLKHTQVLLMRKKGKNKNQ